MVSPELLTGLGAAAAIFLSSAGSCYGSAHSGVFAMRTHPVLGWKSLIPIVQSGVLAIYGLIIGILLIPKFDGDKEITATDGYRFLAAGLVVGSACLCSGFGIGLFLKLLNRGPPFPPPGPPGPPPPSGAEDAAAEPLLGRPPFPPPGPDAKGFRTMVLVLIFLEAIGLYGLIVGLCAIGK